jgi:hypothetical protein
MSGMTRRACARLRACLGSLTLGLGIHLFISFQHASCRHYGAPPARHAHAHAHRASILLLAMAMPPPRSAAIQIRAPGQPTSAGIGAGVKEFVPAAAGVKEFVPGQAVAVAGAGGGGGGDKRKGALGVVMRRLRTGHSEMGWGGTRDAGWTWGRNELLG